MKITLTVLAFFTSLAVFSSDWQRAGFVTDPGIRPSISVCGPSSAWIADGFPGAPKIFKTSNRGEVWSTVQTSGINREIYCIWAMNDNLVFVGEGEVSGNAQMLRSTDGGQSWTSILNSQPNGGHFTGLAFTKANSHIFGLSLAERIYRSSNSGLNWVVINPGVNGVSNAQNSLMIIDNDFYGFGLNNGAARVRITTNNAASWNTYHLSVTGNYTSAIAFHSNKLLGLGATSTSPPMVARTTDGGVTWNSIDIGSGLTGTCYLNWVSGTPVVYILGSNGGIKRSTDNGLSWVTTPVPQGVTNITHFDFYVGGMVVYGYAVSSNGDVIRLVDTLEVLTGINNNQVPSSYSLKQNYPNPFNPTTLISYSIPKAANVRLSVYNALGKEIEVLVNEKQNQGSYDVVWNGDNYSSGVYFYKIQTEGFTHTKKMILLK
jgi:photosystem II stability/assembly factor-like uncharacterized protein